MCLKKPPVPQLVQNYPPLFNPTFLTVFTKASDWTPSCKYVWSVSINAFLRGIQKNTNLYTIYKAFLRFCILFPAVGRKENTRWCYKMFSVFFRPWEVAISVTTCGTAAAVSGCDTKPHFQLSLNARTYTFSISVISSSKFLLLYWN
jgi:hypothetical protein